MPEAEKPATTKRKKPAAHEHPDTIILRRIVLDQHAEQKHEWLRAQFTAWWANLLGEIEELQLQLNEKEGDLNGAFSHDERWELDLVLDAVWHKMAGHGPKCVPTFLKASPTFIAKQEASK